MRVDVFLSQHVRLLLLLAGQI